MRKRVLITGGAGFIGSHLCRALLGKGFYVICLDNFLTGSKDNIVELMDNPYFELMRHDVINPLYIEVDQIYNLACPASPVHYQRNPIKTVKTNMVGSLNMLGLARRVGAPILQASTSEVYGDPQVHPQPENYNGNVNPIGPRACYDEGKRIAETLFFDYHRQYGVEIKVMRIFNTYGPNMHINDGRVISNFIVQALESKDITIYGDGLQTRSFCYISDLVEGMVKFMDSKSYFTGPLNMGNPVEITILDLAKQIIYLTNSKSKIIFKPLPVDDPIQRKPIIQLAQRKLEWSPKVSLNEGLEKTIGYFMEVIKINLKSKYNVRNEISQEGS